MADFEPKRKSTYDFNNGVQLQNGDSVQAEFLNNVVESQLFTQGLATNAPDVSEIAGDGEPTIEITTALDGSAKLKPKNLKGKDGTGISRINELGYGQVGEYTGTDLEFDFTDRTRQEITVYAKNGEDGEDGETITDITNGPLIVSDETTVTPITIRTNRRSYKLDITAKNGENAQIPDNLVTTDTDQNISGHKTFSGGLGYTKVDGLQIDDMEFAMGGQTFTSPARGGTLATQDWVEENAPSGESVTITSITVTKV